MRNREVKELLEKLQGNSEHFLEEEFIKILNMVPPMGNGRYGFHLTIYELFQLAMELERFSRVFRWSLENDYDLFLDPEVAEIKFLAYQLAGKLREAHQKILQDQPS